SFVNVFATLSIDIANLFLYIVKGVSQCHDWGEWGNGAVVVMEGEAGWLSCPLFSHPTVYNYSLAQAAGLNLVWYHVAAGQDLEQPINFHHPDQRLSKDREWLWLQPATVEDTGQYICMLRNRTSCAKIALHLKVVPRDNDPKCKVKAAVPPTEVNIPIQGGEDLTCPDLKDVKLPNTSYSVTWYHNCDPDAFQHIDRRSIGGKLLIHIMYEVYQGPYHCVVTYETKGRTFNFTRVVNVTAVSSSGLPKEPNILNPTTDQLYLVKQGSEVNLTCRVMLPFLEGPRETWWTVDGKTVEQFADPRFSFTNSSVNKYFGDWTVENVLHIKDFNSEDLRREYNCSGRNNRGMATRRAVLEEEVYLPSVELGCGLGVTLFLMLVMFVVYHIFWLELLLIYRSWFGTDERSTDDKEYDIYISYARNSEEEQFVLLTLRRVLENELGYTVCIFDRDSLPGGTITDETLSFVGRSRRLLVVLSPGYGLQGTQALLELKAGLDSMAWGGHLRVILVQYKPLGREDWVCELKRARVALVLVLWQGEKSMDLSSRFWKRLQVELPVRRVKDSLANKNCNAITLQNIAIDTDGENNTIMEKPLIQRIQSGEKTYA
uniref:Interleukin 1 receptor accessory protein n=1 Tax=Esox lucius TaxID=8010 RepID=A0A3P8XAJ9_ESOLU